MPPDLPPFISEITPWGSSTTFRGRTVQCCRDYSYFVWWGCKKSAKKPRQLFEKPLLLWFMDDHFTTLSLYLAKYFFSQPCALMVSRGNFFL